jgi:hypothetical protein
VIRWLLAMLTAWFLARRTRFFHFWSFATSS